MQIKLVTLKKTSCHSTSVLCSLLVIILILANSCSKRAKVPNDLQYRDPGTIKYNLLYSSELDFHDDQVIEAYRFLYDHSLGPAMLISVNVQNDETTLNFKIAAHPNTSLYKPGELLTNKTLSLTNAELQRLRDTVKSNKFWKQNISKDFGLDGAGWTIEVKQEEQYYTDYQWSPEEGSIRNIGICLLELSPYNFKTDELYIFK